MPTNSLTAKANTGAGTDTIAGVTTAQGFVGAGMMTDATGADITIENPFSAAAVQNNKGAGYSASGASVLDIFFAQPPVVTGGMTYNQAAGSLNIVAGIGVNAEFLARSVSSFSGAMRLRASHILSQRIANNNFSVLLADLLGENLAYNIINSTTVDVTDPAHGFNSENIGQFIMLGGLSGVGIPGRYAIASIPDANTIRFTVAGWPASGTGTLTLFGRNHLQNLFSGTNPANVTFDTQRNGWALGGTTAAIVTTASPGVVLVNELTGREAFLFDKLRASSTSPSVVSRASRDENIPDQNFRLHVFLWAYNGSAAPASSTTWTLGHTTVESFPNQSVYIQGVRANGAANPLPVAAQASAAVIGDVGIQYRANSTGAAVPTAVTSPLVPAGQSVKSGSGRLVVYDFHNQATTRRFVKFFNATTVTMGTTSATFEVAIEPGQSKYLNIPGGIGFNAGIQIAVTSARGLTDNTTTGIALGDVTGFVGFA